MDDIHVTRFRERVQVADPDACWNWQAAKNQRGYGVAWCGDKTRLAHRVAWFLETGQWPSDCLCHRCDNPACCNPRHLFEGSRADNLADMRTKGRAAPMPVKFGSANHTTPLSEGDVRAIRSACADGEPQAWVARRYGVSTAAIHNIWHRKTWRHLT